MREFDESFTARAHDSASEEPASDWVPDLAERLRTIERANLALERARLLLERADRPGGVTENVSAD